MSCRVCVSVCECDSMLGGSFYFVRAQAVVGIWFREIAFMPKEIVHSLGALDARLALLFCLAFEGKCK